MIRAPVHPLVPQPVVRVKFRLLTDAVKFVETGLPQGESWTVSISSPGNPTGSYPLSLTASAGVAIVFRLPVGNYNFTITDSGTQVPGPVGGSVGVSTAPAPAQVIGVTFS